MAEEITPIMQKKWVQDMAKDATERFSEMKDKDPELLNWNCKPQIEAEFLFRYKDPNRICPPKFDKFRVPAA